MASERIVFRTVRQAVEAINALGSSNSEIMGTRAVHINVLVLRVPGPDALILKRAYNEVGAEAAVSHDAYYGTEGAITDMIVMGSVYQHREVRRILADNPVVKTLIAELEAVVENAPETLESSIETLADP
jgi:hypothetical protein